MYYSGTFSTVSVMTLLSRRSSAGEAKEWNTSSDIFNKSFSFFCNSRSNRHFIHLLIHTTGIQFLYYNSWYYSSSWTAFIHLPFHTTWISFVYYSPSRTQSGLELHWQVTTIEVPGLRCKSISKPNPRWNKLDIPGYPGAIHYLLHKYRTTWHSQWRTP